MRAGGNTYYKLIKNVAIQQKKRGMDGRHDADFRNDEIRHLEINS